MIGARTELSELTGPMGINRLISRVVPEPLAPLPVVVATGTTDSKWTTLVFQVVKEIESAGPRLGIKPGTPMPDGIRSGWQADVVAVLYPRTRRSRVVPSGPVLNLAAPISNAD
jgi:hypothetical protein